VSRGRSLDGWRCGRGHAFVHEHKRCPACGASLRSTRIGARAKLVACTTVRVTPSGEPFRLGVAVTREGARTLCRVEGGVRGNGYDRVLLVEQDGRYLALGAGSRVSGSRVRRASDEDWRRS
jgi:uncharacterized OB-fold protein